MAVSTLLPSGTNIGKVCNSSAVTGTARVIVSVGDSFDSANCAAMYQAREVVRGMSVATGEEQKELQELKDNVKPEWMENWFDGLTYCMSKHTCEV